jgi:hypothetical protein
MDYSLCLDGNCLLPDLEKRTPKQKAGIDPVLSSTFSQLSLVTGIFWSSKSHARDVGDCPDVGLDSCLHFILPQNQYLGSRLDDSLPSLGEFCDGTECDHLVPQSIKKANQHC